jgi:3-oxoacyl-[acyl-carrier protein] reductase
MILKNKIAIISGGARGLGKMISEMLLENNVKIVILDINQEAMDEIEDSENIFKIVCDLTKEGDVAMAIQQTLLKFHKIDILINNAGILYSEPLVNLVKKQKRHSIEAWKKVLDINLTAPFVLASYVAEQMVMARTKGVIVNISSISAKGNVGQTAYSAAKAGLESMTMVWAKELGSFGIRAVAVAPGFMATTSTQSAVSQEILEHVKKETPINKLGRAEDVAHAVKFAIENEYLNGKTINIDGGLVL